MNSMLRSTVLLLVLAASAQAAAPRVWTSDTGSQMTATYVRAEGEDSIVLRREDGREFTLPLSRLSAGDRAYARSLSDDPFGGGKPVGAVTTPGATSAGVASRTKASVPQGIALLPSDRFEPRADFVEGWRRAGFAFAAHAPNKVEYREEGGVRFVRVVAELPDKTDVSAAVDPQILLPADAKTVTVSFRARLKDFRQGEQSWHRARARLEWAMDSSLDVRPTNDFINVEESADWRDYSKTLTIPRGASALEIKLGFIGGYGTADFADVRVTVP